MNPLLRRWTFFILVSLCIVLSLTYHADFFDSGSPHSSPSYKIRRVSWKDVPQHYPVSSIIALPTGTPAPIPKIQYDFQPETKADKAEREKRLEAVKKSFLHSWKGYKRHAWLQDEVAPLSGSFKNDFGGWAATLVDSLDTLSIMGLEKEFAVAVAALKKINFSSTQTMQVNVFETTIRYLGGLLSAHDLSGGRYPLLLEKAEELGGFLMAAFDTPNHMPITRWDWENSVDPDQRQEALSQAFIAEVGSLSLEFTRLSQLTGDPRYYDAVQRIADELEGQQNSTKLPGLWPVLVNTRKSRFTDDRTFTLGGMADSLYEYFPKQHLLLGGLGQQNRRMYETAIDAAKEYLFFRPMNPKNQKILLSGTVRKNAADYVKLNPEGQHLACFTGGMVGLGAKIFDRPYDVDVARQLVDGCIWAYESMPTGIAPEIFSVVPCSDPDDCKWSEDRWHEAILNQSGRGSGESSSERVAKLIKDRKLAPGFTNINDKRYILRPEAIESVFIMYRITGDKTLQDAAWRMFQAIISHTQTDISNAAISDVTAESPEKEDTCESFWMAETLKYFYLIFSEPDVVSLDDYVFNTEAHPLRRPTV